MFKASTLFKTSTLMVLLTFSTMTYADEIKPKTSVSTDQQNTRMAEAYDLLEIMQARENYKKTTDAILKQTLNTLPSDELDAETVKKIKNVIIDFFNKYMNWDHMREDMAKLYTKFYTQQELRELKKFYLTPIGQKVLKNTPEIAAESMKMAQLKMMAYNKELERKITELVYESIATKK